MTTTKPVTSVSGCVTLADGSKRYAWKNTYKRTVFSADGTSASMVMETRVEFELLTNACNGGRKYRKVSPKQAETFQES